MPLRAGPMLGGEMWSWVARQKQLQVPSLAAYEHVFCELLAKSCHPSCLFAFHLLHICYDNSQGGCEMPPRQAAPSLQGDQR